MDVSGIAAAASGMAQINVASAVQVAVLKKAMELAGQGTLQLLEAATQTANNPPHLGNQVDTYA